jgi:septum formation protein
LPDRLIDKPRMPDGLILASASPRRIELLRQLGAPFAVRPSGAEEMPRRGEDGVAFARRAARDKAEAVAAANPRAWVIGADTVVLLDGEILGKPRDESDARRMLRSLSGRRHRVVTAVALVAPGGVACEELAIETAVEFHILAEAEIDAYVATGEPSDKAGAYAIQGGAQAFVRAVEGSLTNVVGLPLEEVRALFLRHRLLGAAADPRGNP